MDCSRYLIIASCASKDRGRLHGAFAEEIAAWDATQGNVHSSAPSLIASSRAVHMKEAA